MDIKFLRSFASCMSLKYLDYLDILYNTRDRCAVEFMMAINFIGQGFNVSLWILSKALLMTSAIVAILLHTIIFCLGCYVVLIMVIVLLHLINIMLELSFRAKGVICNILYSK